MVTQGNIAPDFTLETDRSEKVTLSKPRKASRALFTRRTTHQDGRSSARPDDEGGRTLGPGRFMVLTRLPLHVGTALPSSTPVEPPRASPAGSDLSAEEAVVAYHERTKHHYHRFASSLGYMDWATQPDPFRRYEGASLVRLPFPRWGKHCHTGSSTSPTAWSQPRFRLTPSRCSSATPSR